MRLHFNICKKTLSACFLCCFLVSGLAFGESKSSKTPSTGKSKATPTKSDKSTSPSTVPAAVKVDAKSAEDGYIATPSTKIDFTETSIDGQMKTPEGFMLQGQQSNNMNQMVKLRNSFRNELNNSKSATKAIVK